MGQARFLCGKNCKKTEIFLWIFLFLSEKRILHSFLSFFQKNIPFLHVFFKKSRIFNGKLSKIY